MYKLLIYVNPNNKSANDRFATYELRPGTAITRPTENICYAGWVDVAEHRGGLSQSFLRDKGNMPLHRGMPTLGAKPEISRLLCEAMLTYRKEE